MKTWRVNADFKIKQVICQAVDGRKFKSEQYESTGTPLTKEQMLDKLTQKYQLDFNKIEIAPNSLLETHNILIYS